MIRYRVIAVTLASTGISYLLALWQTHSKLSLSDHLLGVFLALTASSLFAYFSWRRPFETIMRRSGTKARVVISISTVVLLYGLCFLLLLPNIKSEQVEHFADEAFLMVCLAIGLPLAPKQLTDAQKEAPDQLGEE